MILGILIAILPFLGFTVVWNKSLNMIAALLIVVMAYLLTPGKGRRKSGWETGTAKENRSAEATFVEHHGQVNNPSVTTDTK